MARIDEKRKQRLEQAIRDMGNYGVKLRKPEELPDFDQPSDYEEEKRRFEPVDKVEEQNDKESNEDFSQPSYQETALSPTERATSTEEFHQRMGKTKDRKQLSEFQGKYLQPFRNSHRKAVYVSEETQRKLDFVVRRIGEHGLRRVTVFNECSNTAGAYNPIFYISKVCLCTTNCNLYHKDPCPERGLNHSEVVIIIYPLSYFKVVSKKQDYSGIPSFRVFDDEKGCPNMYFK